MCRMGHLVGALFIVDRITILLMFYKLDLTISGRLCWTSVSAQVNPGVSTSGILSSSDLLLIDPPSFFLCFVVAELEIWSSVHGPFDGSTWRCYNRTI